MLTLKYVWKQEFLGDIVVGLICYKPPDQEEQADGTLYRHVGAAYKSTGAPEEIHPSNIY